ncbi:RTC4-like domain-containing protein [Fusarium redolens]|uniref:Restriction of telomere capping protein 4 n=1 Tax=Fusarium redolens TaxID=48865 RepID=A0A9P9KXR0_FUSRE|nr:RTC4-like domain-containing protein [Fusarium redolens]KAH7270372.1 RTC4-like domain-containing protein [Fusarium redolens]
MAGRVTGLSRHQKPPPLLSQTRGCEKRKLEQQPDDVNALPMSSEDEVEDDIPSAADFNLRPSGSQNQTPIEQSDDSEPETSARGNIKRTAFNNPSSSKGRRNVTRKVNQKEEKGSTAENHTETSSSTVKRRKLGGKSGGGLTSQFKDNWGFTNTGNSKAKYGSSQPRGSQAPGGSQSSQVKKGKLKVSKGELIHEKTEEDDFLHSSQTEEKPTFKPVSQESFSSPTKSGVALRPVPKDDLGTPRKGGRIETKFTSRGLSATPTKSQVVHATKLSQNDTRRSRSSSQNRTGVWKPQYPPKKPVDRPRTPEYKPATFVAPAEIDGMQTSNNDIGSLSSPVLSDLDELSDTETINEAPFEDENSMEDRMTKCPWCGDLVSEQALKDYSKGKRLNVQMQTRFCAKHKKETAMETWRERGYPHIDWGRLEGRLDDHRAYLAKIVHGKHSFFRDVLAEKIETGQARSLKKEGNLNPGYYGPRGCKLMCDYLVEEFGESLKENATKDRVIAGRGSAAFIQSVLVAELAVQLIMEDMDVSAWEAREIMEESKALGELIHEET